MNGAITTEETYHVSNILKHYAHAKEKHPYFCDNLNDTIWNTVEPKLFLVERSLRTIDNSTLHGAGAGERATRRVRPRRTMGRKGARRLLAKR